MFRKLLISFAFLAAASLPLAGAAEAAIGDGVLA
jgi:hypothetical protein